MRKNLLSLLFAAASVWLSATAAHAQVSLHGIYSATPQTGLSVLFAVHDNNSVGIWIWDSTQQKVGKDETKIAADGSFNDSNVLGYVVAGSLASGGVGTTPTISATLARNGATVPVTAPRSALFGSGNAATYEGRFEGTAAFLGGGHKIGVHFFIDANLNLFFAHHRADGSMTGGVGTVIATDGNNGTFTATSVTGTAITGSFTTDGYVMDGSFATAIGNYEFQAYRVAAAARMINISTRGFVSTGAGVLIGGFWTVGAPKLVLIEVQGPSLTQYGVDGALANPTVKLYSGNKVIATNTGWKTAPNAAEIAKTQWAPTSDADCAILTVLEPGGYTTMVSGVNDTTGIALVAVYELGVN